MDKYKTVIEEAKLHWQEHDTSTAALVDVAEELHTLWTRRVLAKQAIERVLHDLYEVDNPVELRAALREIWRINAGG